jgi:hypothetical protein
MPTRSYEIDFDRLAQDMLPAMLRKPRMLAFVAALLVGLRTTHSGFLSFRSRIAYELPIGPELRVLRHYLNELYDFTDRRITITDGQDGEPLRIYTEGEDQPIYLPVFLAAQSVDFTVTLPESARGFEAEIRRFLDLYKLLTKTYRIIYL